MIVFALGILWDPLGVYTPSDSPSPQREFSWFGSLGKIICKVFHFCDACISIYNILSLFREDRK